MNQAAESTVTARADKSWLVRSTETKQDCVLGWGHSGSSPRQGILKRFVTRLVQDYRFASRDPVPPFIHLDPYV